MDQSSNRNGNPISKTLEHSSETQTGFASPYGTLKEMIRRHGSHLASPRPLQALEQMVSYLNGKSFRKNYTYSGRFKIGQRILSKVSLSNLGRDDPLREASISARRDR